MKKDKKLVEVAILLRLKNHKTIELCDSITELRKSRVPIPYRISTAYKAVQKGNRISGGARYMLAEFIVHMEMKNVQRVA